MVIGVIGSRRVGQFSLEDLAGYIPENCSKIVSGGAQGIDTMAQYYAKSHDIPFVEYLPDYDFFGNKAPLVRNTSIVKASDKVLAFWDYKSRGTAHGIKEAIRLNVPIEIISIKAYL